MTMLSNSARPAPKVVFANQLRGLAVLCVVIAHYIGVFWWMRPVVSAYTGAPEPLDPIPVFAHYIAPPTFNYGPFGVAVFFLISGFVIPFSLEKLGAPKFMAARLLRIFPTYWAVSAITIAVMYFSNQHWGKTFPLERWEVAANLFLIDPLAGARPLDLVNWSLAIEVLFYICAVGMWPLIRKGSTAVLVGFAAAVLALLIWWPFHDTVGLNLSAMKSRLMMVSFIFIGTLFNLHAYGKIRTASLVVGALAIFGLFFAMWPWTPFANQFWSVPANYGYAFVLFSACYICRSKFKPSRLLDFFADISYPLYLCHAISGYSVMGLLMQRGVSYYAAAPFAFALSVGVAFAIHHLVEMPTASITKKKAVVTSAAA